MDGYGAKSLLLIQVFESLHKVLEKIDLKEIFVSPALPLPHKVELIFDALACNRIFY